MEWSKKERCGCSFTTTLSAAHKFPSYLAYGFSDECFRTRFKNYPLHL